MAPPRTRSTAAAAVLVALLPALLLGGACSREETAAAQTTTLPSGAAARRLEDPRARALRAHLDLGRADQARGLLRELEPELGTEAHLLAARLAELDGQALEAARAIEAARAADPDDPRVYATAAELHAAAGRLESARAEIARGIERCKATPELVRAQGITWLCQSGGAARGVEYLESALGRDPGLPFVDRALGQGYLLLCKESLAAGRADEALACIERSLAHDPDDLDARRVASDTLAAAGDLGGAAEALQVLVDEGHPYAGELALLYKRAGIAALVQTRRDDALECFRRARALGLADQELATGATLLDEESELEVERGVELYSRDELEPARAAFERALALDPDALVAHNHLAVVLFRQHDFDGAAEHWRIVLDTALSEDLDLPEPVHLNLAKALFRGERVDEARAVLEAYLARDPDGLWVPDSRAMLEMLDG